LKQFPSLFTSLLASHIAYQSQLFYIFNSKINLIGNNFKINNFQKLILIKTNIILLNIKIIKFIHNLHHLKKASFLLERICYCASFTDLKKSCFYRCQVKFEAITLFSCHSLRDWILEYWGKLINFFSISLLLKKVW